MAVSSVAEPAVAAVAVFSVAEPTAAALVAEPVEAPVWQMSPAVKTVKEIGPVYTECCRLLELCKRPQLFTPNGVDYRNCVTKSSYLHRMVSVTEIVYESPVVYTE